MSPSPSMAHRDLLSQHRLGFRNPRKHRLSPLPRAAPCGLEADGQIGRPSATGAERPHVWRPLSDDEYRNLTVREKIRHHQILAHEAMGKGGPMYRQAATASQRGTHLTPDDMPAQWHEGRREAAFHHAEIKRLREIIANGPMQLARRSA